MHEKNENIALTGLEDPVRPTLIKTASGPKSVRIPEDPDRYSLLFKNENPEAHYDFWFYMELLRQGAMMTCTEMVPLSDGGLLVLERNDGYHTTMENTYIKTIKAEYANFGIMKTERLRVNEYYKGFEDTIYTMDFYVSRFDADMKPLGERYKTSSCDFPPLPPGDIPGDDAPVEYRLRQFDMGKAEVKGIFFPVSRELPPDKGVADFEVDEGDYFEGQNGGPAGIKISYAKQGGNPAFIMNIFTRINPDGSNVRFLTKYCTTRHYQKIYDQVFEKTRTKWFKTKTKISILREAFMVEDIVWKTI